MKILVLVFIFWSRVISLKISNKPYIYGLYILNINDFSTEKRIEQTIIAKFDMVHFY